MRKILTALLVAFAALTPTSAVFADSVINSNFNGYMYPIPISGSNTWIIGGTAGNYALVYDLDVAGGGGGSLVSYLGHQVPFTRTTSVPWAGSSTFHVGDHMALVASNVLSGPCTQNSYTACRNSSNWKGEERFLYGVAPPVLGCMDAAALNYNALATQDDSSCTYPPKFAGMVTDAENGFASTTGFTMAAGVGWSGDNLIKPWMGSGLSLLAILAPWLVAIVAISTIVFFSFRALNNGLNAASSRKIVSGARAAPAPKKQKPLAQKGGGYQAYKLRQALKKGKYKDSKVHSAFGKNWTS